MTRLSVKDQLLQDLDGIKNDYALNLQVGHGFHMHLERIFEKIKEKLK